MQRRYRDVLGRIRDALLGPHGTLELKLREDIVESRIVEPTLNAFVVRVRANASSVTQRDIDKLKAAGFSEDQIFEATLCAAFVAAKERYDAAMAAMEG